MSDELVHPSAELLSDHRADLLEPDVAQRVADHLAGCGRCHADLAALDTTVRHLRDAGRDRIPMPPDVADRIDTALAAEARQRAVVVPLHQANDRGTGAREPTTASARHRRRSLVLVAAGTVAVLAVGGIGANLAFNGGRNGTAGTDTAGGRHSTSTGGRVQAKTHQAGNTAATTALAIDRGNFESVAPIAITTGTHAGRSTVRCFNTAVRAYDARTWLSASVDWHGVRAWLLYDAAHSRGVVVDCSAGPRIMYRHEF